MKFDNSNNVTKQEEEINIKKILYLLLENWYWLVLFGALGLGIAYTYMQFKKPVFSMSSTILIPEESKGFDMKDLFNVGLEQDYTKIYNQIEILKSSFTIKETLLRLNWRTSWFRKKAFQWNGIYKNEPFDVQEAPNYINPAGIRIYVTPTTDNFYTVSVDAKLKRRKRHQFRGKG